MNFPVQKRKQLIQLAAITAVVLLAFWILLIRPARVEWSRAVAEQRDLNKKLTTKKQVIQRAENMNLDLAKASLQLSGIEDQMVSGDTYLWIIKTLRDFEIPGKIEFAKYDPPQVVESNLPKSAPYKAVSFAVSGTATYQDLGAFLARFENAYPYVRVQRLDVEPAGVPAIYEEKLSFLLELRVLVKPSSANLLKTASRF